jgi:hypothetical protein
MAYECDTCEDTKKIWEDCKVCNGTGEKNLRFVGAEQIADPCEAQVSKDCPDCVTNNKSNGTHGKGQEK